MFPSLEKRPSSSKADIPRFEIYSLSETRGYILAFLFFGSALGIAYFMQKTLIPLLEASQLLLAFGVAGFLVAYIFRERLRLSIADGLYYNVFGGAPVTMILFLSINALCEETYSETHQVINYELQSNRYSFHLENDAYDEFWRIRTMNINMRPARTAHIEFTFCNGLLGYKVLQETELK